MHCHVRCRHKASFVAIASAPLRHLSTLLPRVAQVIDQTTQRVLHGEPVPADEKLVSLFESHADVLVKDRRDTYYGHKIFLTTGGSGLTLDCAIPKGNLGDVTWAVPLVRRHRRRFGAAPRKTSMDGAFASTTNLADIKTLGDPSRARAVPVIVACDRDGALWRRSVAASRHIGTPQPFSRATNGVIRPKNAVSGWTLASARRESLSYFGHVIS